MAFYCFKQGCELEAPYVCLCLSSITHCCELHAQAHLKLSNRAHAIDSLLTEPSEYTKGTILEFLAREKLKKEKLKNILLNSFNQNWSNTIEENLKNVESDLNEISDLIEKISQVSAKGWILNPLMPNNDTDPKRLEKIIPIDPELYARVKLFCSLSQLRKKKSQILNRANNDPETEQDFRRICALYKIQASGSLLSQDYQDCINAYQKITSTYLFDKESNLYIYDTESEKEEMKVLEFGKKIKNIRLPTPLINGELFCVGICDYDSIAFIIDKNYQVRELKILVDECILAAIYFNRSIYCFNREWDNEFEGIVLPQRFDLGDNRWIELTPTFINGHLEYWESMIFNGNILFSNSESSHLLSYSIDIDSFSETPDLFASDIKKFLINAEQRLYLIECKDDGYIYESEAENEYVWTKVGDSIIPFDADQVYCSYNKEGVYISISDDEIREYFKFDLSKKFLIDFAYYSKLSALKRLGNKLEAIECYGHTFKLDSNHDSAFIKENDSIFRVGKMFDEIEELSENAKRNPNDFTYNRKGDALYNWGRKLEAIECYNEAIKFSPHDAEGYHNKGFALNDLGRHLEAIECYNEVIKLKPNDSKAHKRKGNNLYKLGRYLEAIECFNEVIKLKPKDEHIYFKIGEAFYCLDRYSEAIECYNKRLNNFPHYGSYLNKGKALCILGRDLEAIDSFNAAIRLKPDNIDAYNSKVKALRSLGRNAEAEECENIIVKLKEANCYFSKGNYCEAIKFYDEQIKSNPDDADFYNIKGYAQYQYGDSLEAIESYSMAIELKPDDPILLLNRAEVFCELERFTEAKESWNKYEDLMQQMQAKE